MNDKEAREYLEEAARYGGGCEPERLLALCGRLGNPQQGLPCIVIAGTNGKGSAAAYISTVLACAGYRTGRFTSPAVFDCRERIQVNGRPVTRQGFREGLERVREAAEAMTSEGLPQPVAFEMELAAAFLYFKKKGCDVAVLEAETDSEAGVAAVAGTPLAAVFTPIGIEHAEHVWKAGESIETIAEGKARIIQNGCAVISAKQRKEAEAVLACRAEERGSSLIMVSDADLKQVKYGMEKQHFSYGGFKSLTITMGGKYQVMNGALAVETIKILQQYGFTVTEKQLREGLLKTEWKGRFTIIARKPLFLIDGAHTPDAAGQLAESLRSYLPGKRMIFITGMLKDSACEQILNAWAGLAEHIVTVKVPGHKETMEAYELAKEAQKCHPSVTAADSLEEAAELGLLLAGKDGVIVAAGSLLYLGALTKIIENRDKNRRTPPR